MIGQNSVTWITWQHFFTIIDHNHGLTATTWCQYERKREKVENRVESNFTITNSIYCKSKRPQVTSQSLFRIVAKNFISEHQSGSKREENLLRYFSSFFASLLCSDNLQLAIVVYVHMNYDHFQAWDIWVNFIKNNKNLKFCYEFWFLTFWADFLSKINFLRWFELNFLIFFNL